MWARRNQHRSTVPLRQSTCPSADALRNDNSPALPRLPCQSDRPGLQLQNCPHEAYVDPPPGVVHNDTDDSSGLLSCPSPSHGQEERWGVSLQRFLRSLTAQLASTTRGANAVRATGVAASAMPGECSQGRRAVATEEDASVLPTQLHAWPYASSTTQDAFERYALERLSPVVCSNLFFNATVCGPGHGAHGASGWGGGREFDRRRDHALCLRLRELRSLRVRVHKATHKGSRHECTVQTNRQNSGRSGVWAYLMPRHFEPRFAEFEEHMHISPGVIRSEARALDSESGNYELLYNACICDGWARAAYALHVMDTSRTPAGKVRPSRSNTILASAHSNL